MNIIEYSQIVPISLQTCWEFFSSPSNLKLLTPDYLGFTENSHDKAMYEGQIIIHFLSPIGRIRMQWVTEITHVKPLEYFIDEQRIGPYKFWHHEHRFQEVPGGTNILDKIHYELPYGIIGKAINQIKIKRDLRAIFAYRQSKIIELFGSASL